jgi:predicted nucleic acid-binding protein
MPQFNIPGAALELPRNLALLDTNVLVAVIDERDQHYEQTAIFVDGEDRFRWFVAPPVIVEACGMLTRRRGRSKALELFRWLLTHENVVLLPALHAPVDVHLMLVSQAEWMRRFEIDYVDAYLMDVADKLTSACNLRPYAPIITFDAGDYIKCSLRGYLFSLYDMRDFSFTEFNP